MCGAERRGALPGRGIPGLYSLLRLTACLALLLGSCAKDPDGPGSPGAGADIALYIPAPERVETYSGATIDECRIDNAVVLACKDGRITGAEVVDIILGNGTQQPTLRFRKLDPANGETIVVLCNLDPADLTNKVTGLVGQNLAAAQAQLKPRSAAAAAGGTAADMKVPLTMAGEGVWDSQNRSAQVRMTFQCAKISVVLDPSLTAEGGALAWTTVRSAYLNRMPATTQWTTVSSSAPTNETGTLSQSGTPGYDPTADPMSFPALYTYEAAKPADWPQNRAFNYVLLQVSAAGGSAQYYCLTYDQTNNGKIESYRPFERGKHYVFRVKDIYKRGYDNIDEALDNPSNAVYEIDVSDDWSKNWEYNGQYAVTADRDTAYVWTTTEMKPLYRFSWSQPTDDKGAPATSTVRLLVANKTSVVPVGTVQLLDKDGNNIPNNTFTFAGDTSPEAGYQFSFQTGANATKQGMWLHVKCGNIEKFVPVGWIEFSATAPNAVDYRGGELTSAIVCRAVMPDGTNTMLDWRSEYVDENNEPVPAPDWITVVAADGSYTIKVAPQENSAVFRPGPAVSDYDLSTKGGTTPANTANCYIVNAPGTYTLPLVYGNAIKNGADNKSAYTSAATGTTVLNPFLNHTGNITGPYIYSTLTLSDAKLLWQDVEGMIEETSVKINGTNLTFRVTDKIDYGNAVLAVYVGTDIAWSWHIWATDYDPYAADGTKAVQNQTAPNMQFFFMTQNLGWCPGIEYEGREAQITLTHPLTGEVRTITVKQDPYALGNNVFYQWGRKDPFPGILAGNVNKPTYGPNAWPLTSGAPGSTISTTSIQTYIKNPSAFNTSTSMDGRYHNLWSADNSTASITEVYTTKPVKTVYDPSPVGFVVPPSGAFTGFTTTGGNVTSSTQINKDGEWENGWNFFCGLNKTGKTIFFPASGGRSNSAGAANSLGSNGYCWSALPNSISVGRNLDFNATNVNPQRNGYNRSNGFSVRPVKEE